MTGGHAANGRGERLGKPSATVELTGTLAVCTPAEGSGEGTLVMVGSVPVVPCPFFQ